MGNGLEALLAERERLRRCVALAESGGVTEHAGGGYGFSPMAREAGFVARAGEALARAEDEIARRGLGLIAPGRAVAA